MSEITTSYKEIPIRYNENTNMWIATAEEWESVANGLGQLQKQIDNKLKEKFVRYDAYMVTTWSNSCTKVQVTSEDSEKEVWVKSYGDGRRSKVAKSDLCPATPDTDALTNQIKEVDETIETLRKTRNRLVAKMRGILPKEDKT